MHVRMDTIKKAEEITKILSHSARRLSYDTFGQSDTQYAWAFKNQYFLLQSMIGSSVFYVICVLMNMLGLSLIHI